MISLSPTPFSHYFSRSIMPHFVILFPGLEGEEREWTDVAGHSSVNKDIFGLQWDIRWETIFYHNPGSFYSFYPIASNAAGFFKAQQWYQLFILYSRVLFFKGPLCLFLCVSYITPKPAAPQDREAWLIHWKGREQESSTFQTCLFHSRLQSLSSSLQFWEDLVADNI